MLAFAFNKMGSEHIISTSDKSTGEFVDIVGHKELPLSKVRRKIGWYKINKAVKELGNLGKEVSAALQEKFSSALKEIDEAMRGVDSDVKNALEGAADEIDVELVEVFKKRHEGKLVDHVRLNPKAKVVRKGKSTVFKVRK